MALRFRIAAGLLFVFLLAVLPLAVGAGNGGTRDPRPTPMMSSVQPDTGRTGDVLTVSGIYLDASFVRELYLTAGGQDVKAEILEQSSTAIRFKIPATVKPGRYCLTVLTTEDPPSLLEQPGASLTVTETR
jgi:IPT/TIG domain